MLRDRAIVKDCPEHPLRGPGGRRIPWVYYYWAAGLDFEGLALSARCLLDELRTFSATQLAAYGLTSVPIVSACVLAGKGRYSGLAIRKVREAHGTARQIEGNGDPRLPVVVLDDCIGSGGSLYRAIKLLEAEGFRVEGAICLVNLPWKGGVEWAEALGLKVRTLFDVWKDLEQPIAAYEPQAGREPPEWCSSTKLPDGLSPAAIARLVAEAVLLGRPVPRPPASFDRDHDGRGGVFVSIRKKRGDRRLAREGFFRFEAGEQDLPRDLVCAAYAAARTLPQQGPFPLEELKFGVSLLTEQVPSRVADLDFSRYGIAVRSKVQPWKVGGALPNTQFFTSEIEQLRHACSTNARLGRHEPHEIFLHSVAKSIEPGEEWPPFGSSAAVSSVPAAFAERLAARCRLVVERSGAGEPLGADEALAASEVGLRGLGVTLYGDGRLVGCWLAFGGNPDELAIRATGLALADPRHADKRRPGAKPALLLSLLMEGEWIGRQSKEHVAKRLRLGRDTLAVANGNDWTVMLAQNASHWDWTSSDMVDSLIAKAGTSSEASRWRTYDTHCFLERGGGVLPLTFGYAGDSGRSVEATARMVAEYIAGQCDADGIPAYYYWPTRDRSRRSGTLGRVVLALVALARAGQSLAEPAFTDLAERGRATLLDSLVVEGNEPRLRHPDLQDSLGARLLLIDWLALDDHRALSRHKAGAALVRELLSSFHEDGAVTPLKAGMRLGVDHDLLPGVALLALAHLRSAGLAEGGIDLAATRAWYRRRFRLTRSWGLVWWHLQAWSALHAAGGDRQDVDFIFELADWAVSQQLGKNGAFLVDYAGDGPGFHTGCVLEGLADAVGAARRVNDGRRQRTYQAAWAAGRRFMDTLVIGQDDLYCMPAPERALGAVRESSTKSRVRIDYPAHFLCALAKHLAAAD
ncbi:MAG TPA: hypothetical protein VFZ91_08590 [Allosphingosinicella sp.]